MALFGKGAFACDQVKTPSPRRRVGSHLMADVSKGGTHGQTQGPADTSMPDLWPSELGENEVLFHEASGFMVTATSAPGGVKVF